MNYSVREVSATTGIITTVAGNGGSGYNGDGGPATSAEIGSAYSVAVDGAGAIYLTDLDAIRKVSPSGIITTVAGSFLQGYAGDNGPALQAELYSPLGLSIGANGTIYFADSNNNAIGS